MPGGGAQSVFHRLAGADFLDRLLAFQQRSRPPLQGFSAPQKRAAEEVLADPLLYYLTLPSKRVRPALVELGARMLRLSPPALPWLKCYVETLHNGSLLIDDVQDGSALRRGQPCAHLRFGLDRAVTAGLAALAIDCEEGLCSRLSDLPPGQISRLRALHRSTLEELIAGVALDVRWHGHTRELPAPTLPDYLSMVRLKTAAVMLGGVRMLGSWTPPDDARIEAICRAYGLYAEAFQINDDLLNIEGGDYHDLKGFGEDIVEGKLSYVVVRMCEESPQSVACARLLQILDAKQKSDSEIAEALRILQSSPFVGEGRRLCRQLAAESRAVLRETFSAQDENLRLWDEVLSESFPDATR